jgi:hypothetical protein
VIALVPACALNYPMPRYRSQLAFAELLAVPLLLGLFLARVDETDEPSP